MRKLAVGILAHVDAGKTTLSEALLYRGGTIRRLGRVDHRDAFLDTDAMERERGITIFSKQAVLPLETVEITLLDTPGHVDFSAEAERVLRVLDCAVLVISGADGVQAHTRTLWRLLERYGVPVFLFVNKMDLAGADRGALLAELKGKLDGGCVDFSLPPEELAEEAAVCDEAVLERYLETGALSDGDVTAMIAGRRLFPCLFGSALKLEGVDELLAALERYAPVPEHPPEFGARVFKIARDGQGARLTYLKVTGGTLRVKDLLTNRRPGMAEDRVWSEKADQIRIYSGAKFRPVEEAPAGTVAAVTGLSHTRPGDGLGFEEDWAGPALEPVLAYQVILEDGTDPHTALERLRQLEEEDPQLHVAAGGDEIRVQLMGQVQLEILQRLLRERFGMEVSFGGGAVRYRETIAAPAVGIGHFEPLRHYAEVHLLLEPAAPGSGLAFASACPTDVLDLNWQRLILTHLAEKEHLGVLTGSPITDMKITLLTGRAHEKHTEGGDFRQATYRAVRQGLMGTESVLLEPWYDFRLELPAAQAGRAISDIQRMNGETAPPETEGEEAVLTGSVPVAALGDYAREVAAYTRGLGRLACAPGGYRPCAEAEAVIAAMNYDPERDVENTPDSVFCAHGGGYTVPWNEVPARAHLDSGLRLDPPEETEEPPRPARRGADYAGTIQQDKELQAIFERTYGPVKRRDFLPPKEPRRAPAEEPPERRTVPEQSGGPEYLLVDGYNIIFAWDELKSIARDNLDAARKQLCDLLCNYQGYQKCHVIAVFDAYKVKGGLGSVEKYHNIHVVYTKEAETADAYIERATYEIGKRHRVKVATSDGPEQLIILGHGALRLSASNFHEEMERVQGQIAAALGRNNQRTRTGAVRSAMERARGAGEKKEEPPC
nr:translation factor GTPase family protein [uncultured Oscillibacter sp.]